VKSPSEEGTLLRGPQLAVIPWSRTARRLEWRFLPPHIRSAIESRFGSPVVDSITQTAGFTPGFASVLVGVDGRQIFVKAASCVAQQAFADSYRIEAQRLGGLPAGVRAPRLLWTIDEDWVVLGIEYVDAALPARPWTDHQLNQCLDAVEAMSTSLTPAPTGFDMPTAEDELADFPSCWAHVAAGDPDLPHWPEAAELAGRMTEAVHGNAVVHADIRHDNLLIDRHDRVWICDWNWPFLGAPWLDLVMLLIQAHGDGVDAEALLARRTLTRALPPEHVDIVLALLTGYYFKHGDQPVPATSPWLRAQQTWMGASSWGWLCERRGWT
jgi:Phosphotransferase enzyme family